jgi:hypothetical protein
MLDETAPGAVSEALATAMLNVDADADAGAADSSPTAAACAEGRQAAAAAAAAGDDTAPPSLYGVPVRDEPATLQSAKDEGVAAE